MPDKKPTQLVLSPNIVDPDQFYDELLQAHEGLSKQHSEDFNARLILLLCNHIGDRQIIRQALQAAQLELDEMKSDEMNPDKTNSDEKEPE